jgi:hypothetical protein
MVTFGSRLNSILIASAVFSGYCAAVAGAPIDPGKEERGAAAGIRAPVPDATAQAKAEKLIHEVFGNYAAAPAGTRAATATKMLDQASATANDPAARYMLLKDSVGLAAAAGDVTTAMRGVTSLSKLYDVDGPEMRWVVVRSCAVAATTPQAAAAVVNEGLSAAADAVATGNFDAAARLLTAIETAARISKDKALTSTVTSCSEYVRWIQSQASADQLAVERLAKSPGDADANLAHGLFLCFAKSDWDNGLRAIAMGPNDGLKAAALKDLSNPTDASQKAATGNAWWDSAEKEPPLLQRLLRLRAASWYARALNDPKFEGLERTLAERRLAAAPATLPLLPGGRKLDLLKLFADHRTQLGGTWEATPEGLFCSRGGCLLFNYSPPEEYDLQIDFARKTGNDFFGALCPLPHGGAVAWFAGGWGNHAICFAHFVNGGWFVLTAHDVGVAVANGQHYSVTIPMRRESARAYYNGELVSEMPSNNTDLRAGQDEVDGKPVIGLTIDPLSSAMIYKMELTEITGRGQELGPAHQ